MRRVFEDYFSINNYRIYFHMKSYGISYMTFLVTSIGELRFDEKPCPTISGRAKYRLGPTGMWICLN